MKALVFLLAPILATHVAAQEIALMPKVIDVCPAFGCPAPPGSPDPMLKYWDIEIDMATGRPDLIPARDPAMCDAAIEGNMAALKEHYGDAPAISVPDAELVEAIKSLSFPPVWPQSPEAPAPKAPGATDDPFDLISKSHAELDALAARLVAWQTSAAETADWQLSKGAFPILIEQAKAMLDEVRLGKAWPSLAEFSPAAWRLEICKRLMAERVDDLNARLSPTATDTVWAYAFYGELVRAIEPFDRTRNPTLWGISSPFYSGLAADVDARERETLGTFSDLVQWRDALQALAPKVDSFVASRLTAQVSARGSLEDDFLELQTKIAGIGAVVADQERLLKEARDRIAAAEAERDRIARAVIDAQAAISAGASSLEQLRAEERRLAVLRDALREETVRTREAVTEAKAAFDGVELFCNGATYEACTNVAAKRDFDRRRYESLALLGVARNAYSVASSAMIQASDDLIAIGPTVIEQADQLFELRRSLKELDDAGEAAQAVIASASAKAAEIEEATQPLLDAFGGLTTEATELERLLRSAVS